MLFKRKTGVVIVIIILLFSFAAVVQAAPPLQAPEDGGDDGSTLGETLDLDNVKPNLGTVMSDKDTGETDDADTPDGEAPEGDSPDEEGDDPDEEGDDPLIEHPVASALADYFGVTYDEIMGLHESGIGFGNITKAYFFADKLELDDPTVLLDAAHGSGWGNVMKEYGLHPGNGQGPAKEKGTPPGQAKKNGDDDSPELVGQGNGNGNGNNGNGNDNGKGNNGNGNKGGNGKDKNGK